MRTLEKTLILAVLIFTGNACAAKPHVMYSHLHQDNIGMFKFTLPKSLIYIEYVKPKDKEYMLDVKSVPNDEYDGADGYSLMMYPQRNIFGQTHITQFVTLPNTRIPAAVGSEVIDNRKEMIDAFGKLMALSTLKVEEPAFNPTVLEYNDNVIINPLPNNKGWFYSLKIENPPKDAMPFDEFERTIIGNPTSLFPYSSCRSAVLELIDPKKKKYKFRFKLADPSYLSVIEIPVKGQITMHGECGVDVKSEKGAGSSVDWNLIGSIVDKAKGTKEAIGNKGK